MSTRWDIIRRQGWHTRSISCIEPRNWYTYRQDRYTSSDEFIFIRECPRDLLGLRADADSNSSIPVMLVPIRETLVRYTYIWRAAIQATMVKAERARKRKREQEEFRWMGLVWAETVVSSTRIGNRRLRTEANIATTFLSLSIFRLTSRGVASVFHVQFCGARQTNIDHNITGRTHREYLPFLFLSLCWIRPK